LPLDGIPQPVANRLRPLLAPFVDDGAEVLVQA
jgi:hypothetical protein